MPLRSGWSGAEPVSYTHLDVYKRQRFVYASMDISIGTVRETNFQNQTMEEFKLRLDTIREYLVNKYGVVADFMQATFKNLEINVTLPLKHKFKEYHRVFNLMMYNVVLRNSKPTLEFKAENKKNAEQEVTGICKKNNCLEVKIYDKARQLREQNKADLLGEYMRLEITLLTTRKIREGFGKMCIRDRYRRGCDRKESGKKQAEGRRGKKNLCHRFRKAF